MYYSELNGVRERRVNDSWGQDRKGKTTEKNERSEGGKREDEEFN
jgi:hypothetical protein